MDECIRVSHVRMEGEWENGGWYVDECMAVSCERMEGELVDGG